MSSKPNVLIGNKKISHFFGVHNSTSTDTNTRTQPASGCKREPHPTLLTRCRQTMGWVVMALSLAVGMVLLCGQARADNASWMNNLSKTDWMSELSTGRRLSSISLLGTHDSGATVNFIYSQTQDTDIATQLNLGIRVFDIRLRGSNTCTDPLKVYQGSIFQEKEFDPDILSPINSFLLAHPTETVVMRIKREDGDCNSGFHHMVKIAFDAYPGLLYSGTDANPLLKDIRLFPLPIPLPVTGMNERTRGYLESGTVYHTGIVFVDFPDQALIKDIIGVIFPFMERTVSFVASNAQWVCAENAGGAPLCANRTAVGQWERFDVVDAGDGWIGLRAQANNQFVSSLTSSLPHYLLSAAQNVVSEYQKFRFVYQGDGFYALRAQYNLNYVTVSSNTGNSQLFVNKPDASSYSEKFTLIY